MAGLHQFLRPNSSSSSLSLLSSLFSHHLTHRLLLLLTLLPISLAIFAFFLQWRGGTSDRITRLSLDESQFPGMSGPPYAVRVKSSFSSSNGCPENVLGQSSTPVFPYFRGWQFNYNESHLRPKVCITSSTSGGLEQVLPWILYHKVIGITNFFLFVEGKAASASVSKVLESIPGVRVIYRTRELEEQQSKSRIWNESWLSTFFYKPCNHELFVKQTLNMEMAIVMARDVGMDWIFHLDTDELLHPTGDREYSIREFLNEVPADVDMVVFPNYESAVERDDIKEPFSEVSLFKKNYDHLSREIYFGHYREATRKNPNYFLTYGNGKAAARIQDNLRPNGAHRWHNYAKSPKEIKADEAAVLHYTYSKYSDLTSRRDRCGCKPTKDDVKKCFMLEFDRDAFIIASTATEEEMLQWYKEHVVWTDKTLKLKLLKYGILERVYAPMVIIEGLRESGVFASVISAAKSSLSSDSGKSLLITRKTDAGKLFSDKNRIDKNSIRFQGTARKVLEKEEEEEEYGDHLQAVPPLSPPTMESDSSEES